MSSVYDIPLQSIDGSGHLLDAARGKVALIVNVASRCGYTPQYTGLESLYRELQEEGFVVIGCPCNQFGAQEPGTNSDIMRFCQSTYDVSFPMSTRLDVNGAQRHPLYSMLTAPEQGLSGDLEWNFEKFLVSRDGRVLKRYPSGTKPEDAGLLQDIAAAL